MTPHMTHNSPSTLLLGGEALGYDAEAQVLRVRFTAPDSFASPRGAVQGGLIGGFLDEVMGGAVLHATQGKALPLNLDMTIKYLRPVPMGTLIGVGEIVRLGRKVVVMEGSLEDEDGKLLVRATSSAMLTEIPDGAA